MADEKLIRPRRRRRIQNAFYLTGVILITYYLFFIGQTPKSLAHGKAVSAPHHRGPHPPELLANLSLTTAQCEASFPGLTWSIQDVVSQGPFTLRPRTSPVLGRIRNGQLSILKAQHKNELSTEMLASRTASLHQIHRALLTAPAPESLPDTIFALNFQDQPFGTAWAYARQADPHARPGFDDGNRDARTFLMPHFSFWAWKLPFVGSMGRAAAAIADIETPGVASATSAASAASAASHRSFAAKVPKAVWRGTTWFNSVQNPHLRANLLAATMHKPWADVEALKWDTVSQDAKGARTARNSLPIEDFCKYKYVLHTEGVTYSGRFQFLQMCASVVLTPPIGWMQHVTHLARPLFSNTIPGMEGRWKTGEMTRRAWPVDYKPEEANMVFVAPDWGDLEDVIRWLEEHPKVAEGIARRQRETFVDGGYFSPAAETCYWRALIRGWSEVVNVEQGQLDEIGDGQTFESFALTEGD